MGEEKQHTQQQMQEAVNSVVRERDGWRFVVEEVLEDDLNSFTPEQALASVVDWKKARSAELNREVNKARMHWAAYVGADAQLRSAQERERVAHSNRLVAVEKEMAAEERCQELQAGIDKLMAHLKESLRFVALCTCFRPATYARALCNLCDKCAADPELHWSGFGSPQENKELCLLPQAAFVRTVLAYKGLDPDAEKVPAATE